MALTSESERRGDRAGDQRQNETDDLQQRDVGAQQTMARAAIVQILLTIVAIWLLKRTLDATKETVRTASSSNRVAARAVRQARRANDIADKAFRIQNRAYVYASEAQIIWSGDGAPRIEITVSNAGPTPASDVRIHTQRIVKQDARAPFAKNVTRGCHHVENGRPQSIPVCDDDDVRCTDIQDGLYECLRGGLRVGIVGEVQFKTLYNENVIAPFYFRTAASNDIDVQPMRPEATGKLAFIFLPDDEEGESESDNKE